MKTLIAATLVTMISTVVSAEVQQVRVGNDIVVIETSNLCTRGGEIEDGYPIQVFASGQVWLGTFWGVRHDFGFICDDVRTPVRRRDNDGPKATATVAQQEAGQNGVANVPSSSPNGSFGGIGINN
ncbi:MAG: hypothetical protein ACI9SY_000253 [Candidatus Paceibacteria bacterium]|jgi:hypothetical protein